jgi:hypothetical protein
MRRIPFKRSLIINIKQTWHFGGRRWRRLHLSAGFTAALITGLSGAGVAQNISWTNPAGGSWATAANWNLNRVPTTADNVLNDIAGATITYNTTATITSFLSAGGFTMTGGTLTGALLNSASTIQVNNAFAVNGATLSNLTLVASTGGQSIAFNNSTNNTLRNVIINALVQLSTGNFMSLQSSNVLNGTLSIDGGTARLVSGSSLTIGSNGIVQGRGNIDTNGAGANQIVNNGTIDANINGQTLTISGNNSTMTITNASGIVRSQTGSVLSIGTNLTQSGGQTVANGTVNLNSLLLQGGVLTGTGTVTGTINNSGGRVNPGTVGEAGRLNQTGNYLQSSSGIFVAELGGTTQSSLYDYFAVSGNASLGGALEITLFGGYQPTLGDNYRIMSFTSRTGQFSNGSSVIDTGGRHLFDVLYTSDSVFLTYAGIVPEPNTAALFLTVLCGGTLFLRQRKFSKKRLYA